VERNAGRHSVSPRFRSGSSSSAERNAGRHAVSPRLRSAGSLRRADGWPGGAARRGERLGRAATRPPGLAGRGAATRPRPPGPPGGRRRSHRIRTAQRHRAGPASGQLTARIRRLRRRRGPLLLPQGDQPPIGFARKLATAARARRSPSEHRPPRGAADGPRSGRLRSRRNQRVVVCPSCNRRGPPSGTQTTNRCGPLPCSPRGSAVRIRADLVAAAPTPAGAPEGAVAFQLPPLARSRSAPPPTRPRALRSPGPDFIVIYFLKSLGPPPLGNSQPAPSRSTRR